MNTSPTFSVIIPTYNNWEQLQVCLDALADQAYSINNFEIIVVDNASTKVKPHDFRIPENTVIEYEAEPGSYAARNHGAKIAKGKNLAFTDADCLPDKRWLINAKGVFENTNCDLIGGRINLFKSSGGNDWAYIYEKHTSFRQHIHVQQGKSVTANLLLKKDVFESLNGFEQDMKSGGDWEFTERAVKNGFKMVYGDGVIVEHPARKSIRNIMQKQKRVVAAGFLNVKLRYGHSGLRIIGSHLLRGTPAVFKSVKIPGSKREKLIVLLISLQTHFYKIILMLLILTKIIDPEKIRE